MPLIKSSFKSALESDLYNIFKEQSDKATSGDESENPDSVIQSIADKMATAISNAVDNYIKSGDIIIGPDNIAVATPAGAGTVTPGNPAKIS